MTDVRLDPLGPRHLGAMRALIDDAGARRFTRVPEPRRTASREGWLARYEAGRRAASGSPRRTRRAASSASRSRRVDAEAREVELGYIVAPEARGRGVATEMVRALTRWAFDEPRALRVYLLIDVENTASSRVAARCGYVREGVMRSVHLKPGRRIDQEVWSRLPSDPASR